MPLTHKVLAVTGLCPYASENNAIGADEKERNGGTEAAQDFNLPLAISLAAESSCLFTPLQPNPGMVQTSRLPIDVKGELVVCTS